MLRLIHYITRKEDLAMKRVSLVTLLALAGVLLWGCTEHGHDGSHSGNDQHEGGHGDHDKSPSPKKPGGAALEAAGIVNKKCPIMDEDVNLDFTVAYKDKKVAFCCEDCIPKWNDLSDAEKAGRLKQ